MQTQSHSHLRKEANRQPAQKHTTGRRFKEPGNQRLPEDNIIAVHEMQGHHGVSESNRMTPSLETAMELVERQDPDLHSLLAARVAVDETTPLLTKGAYSRSWVCCGICEDPLALRVLVDNYLLYLRLADPLRNTVCA